MKLVDYLEKKEREAEFSDRRLEHFRDNAFLCEVHQQDLVVADGFRIIGFDLTFAYDWSVVRQNPNAVWGYDSLERPHGFRSEPATIAYCPACEAGRQEWIEATRPPKKKKGRKSKKYNLDR